MVFSKHGSFYRWHSQKYILWQDKTYIYQSICTFFCWFRFTFGPISRFLLYKFAYTNIHIHTVWLKCSASLHTTCMRIIGHKSAFSTWDFALFSIFTMGTSTIKDWVHFVCFTWKSVNILLSMAFTNTIHIACVTIWNTPRLGACWFKCRFKR